MLQPEFERPVVGPGNWWQRVLRVGRTSGPSGLPEDEAFGKSPSLREVLAALGTPATFWDVLEGQLRSSFWRNPPWSKLRNIRGSAAPANPSSSGLGSG